MNYKVLLILLLLPFSVEAEDGPDSTMNSNWILTDWEPFTSPDIDTLRPPADTAIMIVGLPTFVVYYIDTVGWRLTFDNRIVTLLEDEGTVPVVDSLWCCLFGEPLLEPVINTVIVGRFTAKTSERVHSWRVRKN